MFVCKECLKPEDKHSILPISRGPCEICHKTKDCYEVYIHDDEPKYPEHEKLDKIHNLSNSIGDFLEWLSSVKKIRFAQWVKEKTESGTEYDVFVQQPMQIEQWLSEYFNIDLKKLEQEKQTMLIELRKFSDKETRK